MQGVGAPAPMLLKGQLGWKLWSSITCLRRANILTSMKSQACSNTLLLRLFSPSGDKAVCFREFPGGLMARTLHLYCREWVVPASSSGTFKRSIIRTYSYLRARASGEVRPPLLVFCLCAMLSCSVMFDSANPWTVARQVPLSTGILQVRILEWVAMLSSRGSSQPRDHLLSTYCKPMLSTCAWFSA